MSGTNEDDEYLQKLHDVEDKNIMSFYSHWDKEFSRAVCSNFWKHPKGIYIVYTVPTKYKTTWSPTQIVGFCAEVIIMAMKAIIFNDRESFDQIMQERKQAQVKKLGRGVKNFRVDVWTKNIEEILEDILIAKFADPYARDLLLRTGDFFLVEAAENDSVWGIGLPAGHPSFFNRRKWGLNMLGKYLMRARAYYQKCTVPSTQVHDLLNKNLLYAEEQEERMLQEAAKAIKAAKAAKYAAGKADKSKNGTGKDADEVAEYAAGKDADEVAEYAAGKASKGKKGTGKDADEAAEYAAGKASKGKKGTGKNADEAAEYAAGKAGKGKKSAGKSAEKDADRAAECAPGKSTRKAAKQVAQLV